MRLGTLAGFCLASAVAGCGAPAEKYGASLKTVVVPQTSVKNQDKVGFCWAYATMGFLESKYKTETGKQINLSEEALAFYRVVDELSLYSSMYAADKTVPFSDLSSAVLGSEFQGWVVRSGKKAEVTRDAYQLIDAYGAVPESVWSVKFSKSSQTDAMVKKIQTGFLALAKKRGHAPIAEAELIQIVSNAFGSQPPSEFAYEGKTVSAINFSQKVLKFSAADYVLIEAETSRDVDRIIGATKASLAKGFSVPIGFGVNLSLLNGGTFSYPNKPHSFYDAIPQKQALSLFGRDGGHAVLVTDFVNKGGQEGFMADAAGEVKKLTEELKYLKIKNSWGTAAANNESGAAVAGTGDGYYKMDLGYLKGEADSGFLSVVVPKDIAAQF